MRWRVPRLEVTWKKDPFSGRALEIRTWTAGDEAQGAEALVLARENVDGGLLDGHLVDLGVAVLGARPSFEVVDPMWMNDDGERLVPIASSIRERIGASTDVELEMLARRLAPQPYLSRVDTPYETALRWLHALHVVARAGDSSSQVYALAAAEYTGLSAY